MGKQTTMTCDICKQEIEKFQYFIRLKPGFLTPTPSGKRLEDEDAEWYICSNCLSEIARRVTELSEVEVEVRMNETTEEIE